MYVLTMKLLTSLSWIMIVVGWVSAGVNSKKFMLRFDQKTFPTWVISLTSPSAVYCAVMCKTLKMCTFYSYNVADKICLIYSKSESSMTLVTNIHCKIYQPECTDLSCYNCGFETDARCMFENSIRDDIDWERITGSTLSSGTGPTSAAEGSYYIYIEATSVAQGAKAVLTSESASLMGTNYCLSFQYHMMGNPGSLKVFAGDKTSTLTSIWEKIGVQPDDTQWKTANVNIPQFSYPVITIEATRGSSFESDISIDDLTLNPGTCN
ncbi:MAM domain-containing protein 2-like [Mytilus galloprovincialis]|uniref:MAM domain-containing protein 2-like n=1 Tax=Mytilus galloprovincialis TaxID=29158 RepID=UPI003F7C57B3